MSEDFILAEACKISDATSFMMWKGTDSELVSIQILKFCHTKLYFCNITELLKEVPCNIQKHLIKIRNIL
jgi:hypothetical protein